MEEKLSKVQCRLETPQCLRVVLYGLGDIGLGTGKLVLERENLSLVGAVDVDEKKAGRDLHELMGLEGTSGITVSKTLEEVLSEVGEVDVVLHAAGSYLKKIYPQLVEIISAGVNIVSSSEELLYPYLRNPELADELDALAKSNHVTVLGTGVNPGFVMDALPLVVSGVCQKVDRIESVRVVDVSTRRKALQQKVGAGLTVEQFEQKVAEGAFGHVGLLESLALLAAGVGWELDTVEETIEPAVAKRDMADLGIKQGQVTGIKQVASGLKDGKELITLDLEISAGAEGAHDSVTIHGVPDMKVEVVNGTSGDLATASALVNAIPQVVDSQPGLALMGSQIFPRYAPPANVRIML
jgi:4-hydroxy-tetrahydrodipicolinate reductase